MLIKITDFPLTENIIIVFNNKNVLFTFINLIKSYLNWALPHYLIRAEMVSMTLERQDPTTQDIKGEPNVSFSVQIPGVLG